MYGLICNDEISLVSHCLFLNFRQALYNIFDKENFKDVRSSNDLDSITHLFIIDEHFGPNVNVWKDINFINIINDKKIKTFVFNFEPIYNSPYRNDAINHQKFLEQINNLTQFLSDVDDFENLKKGPFLNRQYLSKDTYVKVINPNLEKIKDKILFIGQAGGHAYSRRQETLKQVSDILSTEIIVTERKLTYDQFLETLSKYQYVLNPLGIGYFLNLRYYEILKLENTPIQQVTPKMLELITDLKNDYSINFINPEELRGIDFSNFKQNRTPLYLEDYLKDNKLLELL